MGFCQPSPQYVYALEWMCEHLHPVLILSHWEHLTHQCLKPRHMFFIQHDLKMQAKPSVPSGAQPPKQPSVQCCRETGCNVFTERLYFKWQCTTSLWDFPSKGNFGCIVLYFLLDVDLSMYPTTAEMQFCSMRLFSTRLWAPGRAGHGAMNEPRSQRAAKVGFLDGLVQRMIWLYFRFGWKWCSFSLCCVHPLLLLIFHWRDYLLLVKTKHWSTQET